LQLLESATYLLLSDGVARRDASAASGTSWRWLELQKEKGPYLVGPHNLPPNVITIRLGACQVYLLQQILSSGL